MVGEAALVGDTVGGAGVAGAGRRATRHVRRINSAKRMGVKEWERSGNNVVEKSVMTKQKYSADLVALILYFTSSTSYY